MMQNPFSVFSNNNNTFVVNMGGKRDEINGAVEKLLGIEKELLASHTFLVKDEQTKYAPEDLEATAQLTSRKLDRMIRFVHWLIESVKTSVRAQTEIYGQE